MNNLVEKDNESTEQKTLLRRNLSSSDLLLSESSVVPNDVVVGLRSVGPNTQSGDNKVYSFSLEKSRNETADVLAILGDCSGLKFVSNCGVNKRFETYFKYEDDLFHRSSSFKQQYLNEEDQFSIVTIDVGREESYFFKYLKKLPVKCSKNTAEFAPTKVQTKNEITLANNELITMLVLSPRNTEKVYITDTHEVTMETPEKMATDDSIFKKQTILPIGKEIASSQTKNITVFSTEKGYDISIQTDRKNVADQCIGTEDLSFAGPMTAEEEKFEAESNLVKENYRCSFGHQKQHDCIYECCYHRDFDNVIQSFLLNENLQYLTSMYTALKCDHCQCLLNKSCSRTSKVCEENFKSDINPKYCCKCLKNINRTNHSNTSQEALEKLENSKSSNLEQKSSGFEQSPKERLLNYPHADNEKKLESAEENENIFITAKVLRSPKTEKNQYLPIPAVESCLDSFSLSNLGQYKAVVNPTGIFSKGKLISESLSEEQQKSKPIEDKNHKDKRENFSQEIPDETENKQVTDNDASPDKLASFYTHSEICPCGTFHSKKKIVQNKQNDTQDRFSVFDKRKNKLTKGQYKSTSPDYAITGIYDACERVNDYLLDLRPVDEDIVKKAAEILQKRWFELVRNKNSDILELRYYIQYFKEFSNNLMKTVLYSVDNNGNNVLHFAFANNKFDLVDEFLEKSFASELLNKGNNSRYTPLMICAISQPNNCSDWAIIRKCFELSDVNKSDKNGQTPLMIAASFGSQAMVKLLLDKGANPNLQDKDGSTALMYAAEHGHEKCIKSLMKHEKCNPTIRDQVGETACSIALSNGHKNIAVLIHMQALERGILSKKRYSTKHYRKAARKKAMIPEVHSL